MKRLKYNNRYDILRMKQIPTGWLLYSVHASDTSCVSEIIDKPREKQSKLIHVKQLIS